MSFISISIVSGGARILLYRDHTKYTRNICLQIAKNKL